MNTTTTDRSTDSRVSESLPPISIHEVMMELFRSEESPRRMKRQTQRAPKQRRVQVTGTKRSSRKR